MRPLPLCLGLLAASLVAVAGSDTSEVTAAADLLNITDLEISDLSSGQEQEAVVHVNTNTLLLEAGEEEDNDTMSRPQLSVTVDYETPEDAPVEAAESEAGTEDKYLSLDSYNVHSPQFHPQVDLKLEYIQNMGCLHFFLRNNVDVDNNLLLHHFSGTLLVKNTVGLTFRRHLSLSTRI